MSVIMSTCNTDEKKLREAVESILAQTLQNIEFIIVVDGGHDDMIIKDYNDERIKLIKNEETMGLPYSLNKAIEIAQGEYIARMDSDDISVKNRLEIESSFMDNHKEIDICAMFYRRFGNEKGTFVNVWNSPQYVQAKLFYKNIIPHPTVMFRTCFLQKNNVAYSLDYKYSQDFELWTRLKSKAKIAIIPKIGLKYRIHGGQISTGKKNKQEELYFSILERNLKELEISKEKLKYLLMLNNKEASVEFEKLANFVEEVLEKNGKMKIYNQKALNKVLNAEYFRLILRDNKKILFCTYAIKRYLHLYVFQYYIIMYLEKLFYKYF